MAHPATSPTSTLARALPWISGLVLIAGVVAFLVVKLGGNDSSSTKSASPAPPAQQSPPASATPPAPNAGGNSNGTTKGAGKAPRVQFDAKARQVAGTFILTAVQRKHLDRAWPIAGPAIRQDSTYKQWLTGDIAVIPFLGGIAGAKMNLGAVTANSVDLTVALIPKAKSGRPQYFEMTLVKVGAGKHRHWVVNNWFPRGGGGVVPNAAGNGS